MGLSGGVASDVRMSLDEYLGAIAVHWALDTYAPLMKRLSL